MKRRGCRAKQYSDTMICDICGLQWGTDDVESEVPECRPDNKPEPTGMNDLGCSMLENVDDYDSNK